MEIISISVSQKNWPRKGSLIRKKKKPMSKIMPMISGTRTRRSQSWLTKSKSFIDKALMLKKGSILSFRLSQSRSFS